MEQKHSGIGIASFVISLIAGLGLFALIIVAGVMETRNPGGVDEESPLVMLLGLAMIALLGLDLGALVLGICGFFQKDRQKLFPILGTTFSALTIITVVALMIVGTMME